MFHIPGDGGPSSVNVLLPAPWSNNTGVLSDVTGMSYPTVAGGTYLIDVFGYWSAVSNGIGLQWGVVATGGVGAALIQVGNTQTTQILSLTPIASDSPALGTFGFTTNLPMQARAMFTSAAGETIRVRGRTETPGSAVTIDDMVMVVRRLR